ncbi:hypothetical protein [Archaeoglobus veneficus]|uniref:Uncharacterized protein n=1 Tax=Archaeoglobus veneficus (strain DSM 11195 / SNP6) TaxID=693661 RepID=F2KQZ7_ARCVS|nr:hypothetical protein [Archaeoglobus veneficus]AEA47803.1 hypothetical protein Arcve_1807 [Archaeoglobus veneficus SNP6]
MLVVFVSHRVEFLPLFEEEAKKWDTIILEEPRSRELDELFKGKMGVDEYAKWLDTPFPLFTRRQAEMLVRLHRMGKRILEVEPYLQVIEGIHDAVERGQFEEYVKDERVQAVREIERRATEALIRYQEVFMQRDFDKLVDATVSFAKVDADRFRMRDYMRAKAIAEIADNRALIEAGQMHVMLPEYLRRMGIEVKTLNLPEVAARKCGIEFVQNPGTVLTRMYILGKNVSEDEERLLAAQALVYISLVGKEEMVPTENSPFPHLLDETKVAKFASRLSYEDCRRFFERVWGVQS